VSWSSAFNSSQSCCDNLFIILIISSVVSMQEYSKVAMMSYVASSVPVRVVRLLYASINLVTAAPPKTCVIMVRGRGIWLFSLAIVRAKDWVHYL